MRGEWSRTKGDEIRELEKELFDRRYLAQAPSIKTAISASYNSEFRGKTLACKSFQEAFDVINSFDRVTQYWLLNGQDFQGRTILHEAARMEKDESESDANRRGEIVEALVLAGSSCRIMYASFSSCSEQG